MAARSTIAHRQLHGVAPYTGTAIAFGAPRAWRRCLCSRSIRSRAAVAGDNFCAVRNTNMGWLCRGLARVQARIGQHRADAGGDGASARRARHGRRLLPQAR